MRSTNESKTSLPGPPKKGFWGFIAGLFPRRPDALKPPTPTADTSLESKASDHNPSDSKGEVPQTEEAGAPNNEGEKEPPTLATPQDVKAPTLKENEDNPPTLPTVDEGSAGSEEDSSTPDPGESYDPKENR
jgi:hypothetical protein